MVRLSLVLASALAAAAPLSAATWAESMFDELKKDFGSVPRGPGLQHSFRVTNHTANPASISSVRVSCGCLTAIAHKGVLQPGESTTLQVNMDTTRYGRPVTVFVQFSTPAFEEVRLLVSANVRSDFALSPDNLGFGQVKRGSGPAATLTVTFYGHPDAQITKVKSESNYIQATVVEARRLNHEVVYTVTAKIRADTPVGKWYTDLWVESTVLGLNQIRLPLTVEVQPPLTASPALLSLGALKAGAESGGKVIVRGTEPFKIVSIKGLGDGLAVAHDDKPREIHILAVKATPGKAGKVDRTFKVVTDLKADNEVEVKVDGEAVP
ncbi:MAG: DUF1573 domain-containing protein [Gemmataceae bacterium]